MPGYRYYCKSDDDTLVHLDHLTALVDELQRALPADKPVYLGHTKWRGWDVDDRFQACGGGWARRRRRPTTCATAPTARTRRARTRT